MKKGLSIAEIKAERERQLARLLGTDLSNTLEPQPAPAKTRPAKKKEVA